MIVYENTKAQFHSDVIYGVLTDRLETVFREFHLSGGSTGEYRAWNNSLPIMDNVLELSRLPDDIRVSIELQIPLTAKRIDFLVSGFDEAGHENVVIVELKQWEDAEPTAYPDLVNTFVGGNRRNVAHPCYQARSYAETIENFNESFEKKEIQLRPCAFLHNFPASRRRKIDGPLYSESIFEAPLFLKEDRLKLADFISRYVKTSDQGKAIYAIDHGRIKPSKALQDAIVSILKGNEEFVLLDDQKVAFERILGLVEESQKDHRKRTVLVKGGPGTGKSVLAVNLLSEAIHRGLTSAYVTKNAAPRNVYFEKFRLEKGRNGYLKNLFLGSGSFVGSRKNEFDFLICDEAHRLNAKSGIFQNKGENQVKEIIDASLVNVFFLDEDQIVTLKDIGSSEEVAKWANKEGSLLYSGPDFALSSQFRCNGSDAYLAFVDSLLGIRETAHPNLEGLNFDFRVYDDPGKMMEDLRKLNADNKARMLAGYCYDWVSKGDPSLFDIEIGSFKAQWNFNSTSTWAIDPDSFDQIGCIHTSQGLEFDHVGVIIGKDLVYRDGKVMTDYTKRAKTDQSLRGLKKMPDKSIADKIIRDTYKVLLTRGQKSCYVYAEDDALRDYIGSFAKKEISA